jgi:hypothetical protein
MILLEYLQEAAEGNDFVFLSMFLLGDDFFLPLLPMIDSRL